MYYSLKKPVICRIILKESINKNSSNVRHLSDPALTENQANKKELKHFISQSFFDVSANISVLMRNYAFDKFESDESKKILLDMGLKDEMFFESGFLSNAQMNCIFGKINTFMKDFKYEKFIV